MGNPEFSFEYKYKQTQHKQMNNNKTLKWCRENEDMEAMIMDAYWHSVWLEEGEKW